MALSNTQISKTLSYWLRHRPDAAGLTLTTEGWADVDAILAAFAREQLLVDWDRLLLVVETNDKSRFELSADGGRIRARQGHSVEINAGWKPSAPPELLFHGTVERFLASILDKGLLPMRRHHVHLSPDAETATRVGARRGAPVVLRVHAAKLAAIGAEFCRTDNDVWLVDHVPPSFLERV